MTILRVPSPAKLNLFLHIVGRRDNGYHELQSIFQLIDLYDWISTANYYALAHLALVAISELEG